MALQWRGEELVRKVRQGTITGVFKVTETLRNTIIDSILDSGKTGKVYRRRGVLHQASAPGEAPASDTGRLVGSILTHYENGGLTGIVSAAAEYASYLEFGTVRMEPRPFMRPALDGAIGDMTDVITEEIRRALA